MGEMVSRARIFLDDPFPQTIWQDVLNEYGEGAALNQVLTLWAEQSHQPLVLLVDEIDSLVGDTLIAVLRQLRSGYDKRPALFPQSIVLCGVRDVRDYRIRSDREKAIITGGSAFNIKAKSLRMGDFSREEVETLLERTIAEGLKQTWDYMGLCGAEAGHLVIFDRAEGKSWAEKIFRRTGTYRGIAITVWGM